MARLVISVAVSVFLMIGSAYAQSPLTPPKAGAPGTPKLPTTIKNLGPISCDNVLSWIELKYFGSDTRPRMSLTAILVQPGTHIFSSPSLNFRPSSSTAGRIFFGTTTYFSAFPSGGKVNMPQGCEFGFGPVNGILSAYLECKGTEVQYRSSGLTCGALNSQRVDGSYYVSGSFTDSYNGVRPFYFVYTTDMKPPY